MEINESNNIHLYNDLDIIGIIIYGDLPSSFHAPSI